VDVKSESALFSNGYYLLLYQRESCLRDALINGLAEAMKSDEFTALYNRTREAFNNTYSKGDPTPLKAPLNSKPDFQNMANAQITIDGDGFHGSGCLISPDGLAITSHRVVGTKEEVDIIFSNGAKKKARVIKRDPVSNIVLISTDTTGVSSLKLSKSTSGRTGENVFCVGSPVNKALSQSISSGIVSGYREQNGVMFLQTDAKVSNGNNGSPIIDKNGFVIGIVNEKYIGAALEGLSFAVSAEDILNGLNLNTEY
jgi:S1-C subfamily serine protease